MRRPGTLTLLLLAAGWLTWLVAACPASAQPGVVLTAPSKAGPAANDLQVSAPTPKDGQAAAPAVPGLRLQSGLFAPPAGLDPALRAKGGSDIALLICRVPAQRAITRDLIAAGLTVLAQYPDRTYVVRGDRGRLQALAGRSYAHWVGRLPGPYKLAPGLAAALTGQAADVHPGQAIINTYDPADQAAVQAALLSAGVRQVTPLPGLRAFRCTLSPQQADLIAGWPQVAFIEPDPIFRPCLSTSVALSGSADYIRDHFNYGYDVTVGMIDTGLQVDHQAFQAFYPFPTLRCQGFNVTDEPWLYEDTGGHGSHVAGIILGRRPPYQGMCPWIGSLANHPFQYVKTGTAFYPGLMNVELAITTLADNNQSLVINNSWGAPYDTSGLGYTARLVDQAVWDTGQCWVFAAGNEGELGLGHVGSPGAAKNVVTVGSLLNADILSLSSFSSEGPTGDGRLKPDIYAVGEQVVSVNAFDPQGYVAMSGTSMATPHVTGAIAGFIGHYPQAFARQPAAMKAALMATARRLNHLPPRTGALNSYGLHFGDANSVLYYGYYPGGDPRDRQYTYWDVDVPANVERMYVALTWIEPAAGAGADVSVYDDVDLYVDQGGDDNGRGEWRAITTGDNQEFLEIANPPAGHYHISAFNYWTPQPYVPGVAVCMKLGEDLRAIAAPTNLQGSYTGDGVALTWEDNAVGETGYQVFRSVQGAGWQHIADLPADSTGYVDRWACQGNENRYYVRAQRDLLLSERSNIVSVLVPGEWNSEPVHWEINYGANWDARGQVYKPGASAVRLHFAVIETERFYDYLYGGVGEGWSGYYTDVTTLPQIGPYYAIWLVSNQTVHGRIVIDRVEWQGVATGPAEGYYQLFATDPHIRYYDVPADSPLCPYVEALAREGIVSGCSSTPPLYCPASPVTRGQAAVFLCRAAGLAPYYPAVPTFRDVPASHPLAGFIEALARAGITAGCRPGYYCPGASVTRGQMAVFLCRAAGIQPKTGGTPSFADVPATSGYFGYVEAASAAGITSGCGTAPPRFCPDRVVTRGEMAVFVCRGFNIGL